jgi:hypothetical protein
MHVSGPRHPLAALPCGIFTTGAFIDVTGGK